MCEAVFWEDHGKGENNQWMDLEKFILLSLLFQVFKLLLWVLQIFNEECTIVQYLW